MRHAGPGALVAALVVALAVASIVFASVAFADHLTLMPEARPDTAAPGVDVRLSTRDDGFRLGARIVDERGLTESWIDGHRRDGDFELEVGVEEPGRSWTWRLSREEIESLIRGLAGLREPADR